MKTACEAIWHGANWSAGVNRDYPLVSRTTGRPLVPIAAPLPLVIYGSLQREGDEAIVMLQRGTVRFERTDPLVDPTKLAARVWGSKTARVCLSRGNDGGMWVEVLDDIRPDDPVLTREAIDASREAAQWR